MRRLATALALILAAPAMAAQAPITGPRAATAKPFVAAEIASFDSPWAMAFLPDGRMLVTEKAGRMLLLSADGKRTVLAGLPEVNAEKQGALGEVVSHPDFAANGLVYFSYSAAGSPNAIVLARGKLVGDRLDAIETLYRAHPNKVGGHYAGGSPFHRMAICSSRWASGRNSIPRRSRKACWARSSG